MGCSGSKTIDNKKSNRAKRNRLIKYSKINELIINEINYSALKVTKYFKNQKPHTSTSVFKDSLFPPNDNSIFSLDKSGKPTDLIESRYNSNKESFGFNHGDIIWKRAKDIFGDKYTIFESSITMTDVNQGGIGNCYLLATLAAMCENPQLIASIFRTLNVPDNGCYEICVRVDGEWQVVMLDDYFPVDKNTLKPVFASPKGPELWVMLLEKAWAKVNGGYLNTIMGCPYDVMDCFTNFNNEFITLSNNLDREKLWNTIIKASSNDYIMACNINEGENEGIIAQDNGLVTGHIYTIINGYEKILKGETIRLVLMRNPWGTSSYSGDYSDTDEVWKDEEYVKAFDYKPRANKGFFFVSFEGLIAMFSLGQVCLVESPQATQIFKIPSDRVEKNNIYEFKIKEENTKLAVQITRPNFRFTRSLEEDFQLPLSCFIVRKKQKACEELIYKSHNEGDKHFKGEEIFDYFKGHSCYDQNLMINLVLPKGDYLVYTYINYNGSIPLIKEAQPCVINLSADQLFDFHDEGFVDDKYCNLLENIIYFYIDSIIKTKESEGINGFSLEDNNGVEVVKIKNIMNSEFSIISFRNVSDTPKKVKLTVAAPNYNNLNYSNKEEEVVILNKNGDEYVAISAVMDYYGNLEITYKYEIENCSEDLNNNNTDKLRKVLSKEYLKTLNIKPDLIDEYEWIYKKLTDFNFNMLYTSIDNNSKLEKEFIKKFPDDMEKILKFPKLNDGVNVYFQDSTEMYTGDNSEYLGEWDLNDDSDDIPHGRGMMKMITGDIYYGQVVKGELTGVGMIVYANGERIEGTFNNGKPVGSCILYKKDGKTENIQY